MNPMAGKGRERQRVRRKPRYYDQEDEEDYLYEDDADDDLWDDHYARRLRENRGQRGIVRRYLKEETSFVYDVTLGPCKRIIRSSCNAISVIITFFAVCFFFGFLIWFSHGIYSFFYK